MFSSAGNPKRGSLKSPLPKTWAAGRRRSFPMSAPPSTFWSPPTASRRRPPSSPVGVLEELRLGHPQPVAEPARLVVLGGGFAAERGRHDLLEKRFSEAGIRQRIGRGHPGLAPGENKVAALATLGIFERAREKEPTVGDGKRAIEKRHRDQFVQRETDVLDRVGFQVGVVTFDRRLAGGKFAEGGQ